MTKQTFTVERVGANPVHGTTHFIVQAASPLGACRVVRNKWPHIVGNHVHRETHALAVLGTGYVSDRIGKVVPTRTYRPRPASVAAVRPRSFEPVGRYRCESERGLSYEP
jgi:hypothetical protein